MSQFYDKILTDLNDKQLEAVTSADGPILILAGAGSGKTRVLTYRAAYLISECGIPAFNILAVTFTNKAAGEMKQRMQSLVGQNVRDMQVSTFHSFCVRILRRFAERIPMPRNFTIYDDEDSLSLIKRCMNDLTVSPKTHAPRAIREYISSAKDKLIGPEEYGQTAKAYFNKIVAQVYELYQRRLEAASALDFDDLLFKTVKLLQSDPQLLESLQNKYRYIMVDEYQDTNHVQYLLVKLLASKYRNICVVGDDDQSIYGWRGADLRNILDFEKDFPGCKVIKLEQNYRSTRTILKAASEVVRRNRSRKDKTLFSEGTEGEKITLLVCDSDRDEAEIVADRIEELVKSDEVSRKDIAILYRTNAQSRALEESLKNRFIPYTIVGGIRFYQRKEIKDVLAYLKILTNPNDTVSLRRVINYPSRGIGDKAQSNLMQKVRNREVSPLELILEDDKYEFVHGKAKAGLKEFASILEKLILAKQELDPVSFVEAVIMKSGILRDIESGDPNEAEARKDNLDELLAAVEEFYQKSDGGSIEDFLEEISLYTDLDSWDASTDAVTLMTLHSAKGLEFDTVFITGLEEGLFPLAKSLESQQELEEERRLFYVGITRARRLLHISFAKSRRRFGEMLSIQSRFVDELPLDLIDRVERGYTSQPFRRESYAYSDDSDSVAVDEDQFGHLQVGKWVEHPTWGEGRIIKRAGYNDSTEVHVLFRLGGRKKLLARYANLRVRG